MSNNVQKTAKEALDSTKAEYRIGLSMLLLIYYSIIAILVVATFFVAPHIFKGGFDGEMRVVWPLFCMAVMWFMLSDKFFRLVNPGVFVQPLISKDFLTRTPMDK